MSNFRSPTSPPLKHQGLFLFPRIGHIQDFEFRAGGLDFSKRPGEAVQGLKDRFIISKLPSSVRCGAGFRCLDAPFAIAIENVVVDR